MPTFDFTSPEGKKYTVEGPAGATEAQAFQILQSQLSPPKAVQSDAPGALQNLAMGAVRGAAGIGATLLAPVDAAARAVGVENSYIGRADRRGDVDNAVAQYSDPNSLAFKTGKIGAEIAGTAGVGGALARPLQALASTRFASGIEPLVNGAAQALQTGGFRVGELAGTGVGAATRIAGGAVTGGASAALVDPSSAGTGAVIGGALPGAAAVAGRVGGAIRRAIAPNVSPEVNALAQRASELGIEIPADRIANNKPMNAVAASLNYVPFSGRAATELRMESQLDKALTRTFGQNSDNVTQALRKADADLGAKFESTLRQNGVNVDRQLFEGLTDVYNRAERELGADALRPIKAKIDDILAKGESGVIDGQAAYNIKKDLDRIGKGVGTEAYHAKELKGVLMDALDRSLGPEQAAAFATTRKQYGNMLALEKLAQNGAEGGISVARLANLKNINNPELQELADIAAQFVKVREGQHGAAQRAVAGLAAGVVGGLPALAGGAAAGRLTNSALNSNRLRDLVMQQGGQTALEPNKLSALTQGVYRTAPLLPAQ